MNHNLQGPPPITEELRATARRSPGGWVYAIDPELDRDQEVPPAGIVGAWSISDTGEIVGEFIPNPAYVASPTARGWPVAKCRLERFVQLHAAGLIADSVIADVLIQEAIWVDGPTLSSAVEGGFIRCYTDANAAKIDGVFAPEERAAVDVVAGQSDPVEILINPGSSVTSRFVLSPAS